MSSISAEVSSNRIRHYIHKGLGKVKQDFASKSLDKTSKRKCLRYCMGKNGEAGALIVSKRLSVG